MKNPYIRSVLEALLADLKAEREKEQRLFGAADNTGRERDALIHEALAEGIAMCEALVEAHMAKAVLEGSKPLVDCDVRQER